MVAKSADLGWGQRHHVLHYLQTPADARHDMHIAINHPVPEGTTVAHLRSALAYLVRRHEILRTARRPARTAVAATGRAPAGRAGCAPWRGTGRRS